MNIYYLIIIVFMKTILFIIIFNFEFHYIYSFAISLIYIRIFLRIYRINFFNFLSNIFHFFDIDLLLIN